MPFISRKRLNLLQQSIDELIKIIKDDELKALRQESKELKNVKELLKPIKFKVQTIRSYVDTDTGSEHIQISYEPSVVDLEFQDGKQLNRSELLRSANMLNFTGLEDQMKIKNEITKAIERSKND